MADKLTGLWAHILRDVPQDMLTVVAVGLGFAAIAIAVLGLIGKKTRPPTF